MDPIQANELNNEGGILFCLNMPPQTEFGIDFNSWAVGPKFMGIKMIPPGIHSIFASPHGTFGDFGLRCMVFLTIQEKGVYVMKWNADTEEFCLENELNLEEVDHYLKAGRQFIYDKNLAPYPYEEYPKWNLLSSFMSESLLSALNPIHNIIRNTVPDREQNQVNKAKKIFYTDIPCMNNYRGSELTEFVMDSSKAFLKLLKIQYKNDYEMFLGEFQYSYISFLIGQDYSSFEQYKKIVFLLTHCEYLLLNSSQSNEMQEHNMKKTICKTVDTKTKNDSMNTIETDTIDKNTNIEDLPVLEDIPEEDIPSETYEISSEQNDNAIGYYCIYEGLCILYEHIQDMPKEFIYNENINEKQPFIIECMLSLALIIKENKNKINLQVVHIYNKIRHYIKELGYDIKKHINEEDN